MSVIQGGFGDSMTIGRRGEIPKFVPSFALIVLDQLMRPIEI